MALAEVAVGNQQAVDRGGTGPPLTAMLSSPVEIFVYAMTPFFAREGSMPSVLGELPGASTVTPQTL